MRPLHILGQILLMGNILGLILLAVFDRKSGLIILAILLLCLLLVYLITVELVLFRPLRKVTERLDAAGREETIEEIFEDGKAGPYLKEIEQVIETYSSLRIRRNNAEIFNKQTELTALQSQINPHFLYNTLDTIRGQAMYANDTEVADMIETLASFFRYSISRKGNMVTLRDELNNINNYMRIQQYRFRNRFSLDIVVDEEDTAAYDYYVPRLILQPIVENAIVHGLEDKMEEARIVIEVTVTDDLVLTVSDNGKGMSLRELDALNRRIHSRNMQLVDTEHSEKRNTGIALPNIHKRIELLYGNQYGLNVYSSIGCGTDVEIVLPINNRAEVAADEKKSC